MDTMNTTTDTASNLAKKSNGQPSTEQKTNPGSAASTGKKETTLKLIFEDLLKDVYSAETQLVKAMPDVVKACYNEELADMFNHHLEQTKRHVERLEKVFSRLQIDKKEENKCEAMAGLIDEMKEIIEKYHDSPAKDSALIIGAQKIEHYEIASYGSLCELADVLGYHQAGMLFDRTLQEEGQTDHMLTDIAQDINDDAVNHEPSASR